jgi:hypothetical protein
VTVDLLLEVGILENCERHATIIFQSGAGDIEGAYKLANSKWTEYRGISNERQKMTALSLAKSESGQLR